MEKYLCKNCKNYHQHYALNSRRLFRVNCGHCVLHITKKKKPDTAACEEFALGQPDENAFVGKEYLSKELLRYVLQLEILPEIED